MLQLPSIFSIPNVFQRTLDPHRQNSTWKTIQSITFLCILFKRKFCKDKFVLALSKITQQYVSPILLCFVFVSFLSIVFVFSCLHASILSNFRFQWHFNCRINGTLQCNGIIHANRRLNHTIRMLFQCFLKKSILITLKVSHVWCYNFFLNIKISELCLCEQVSVIVAKRISYSKIFASFCWIFLRNLKIVY